MATVEQSFFQVKTTKHEVSPWRAKPSSLEENCSRKTTSDDIVQFVVEIRTKT